MTRKSENHLNGVILTKTMTWNLSKTYKNTCFSIVNTVPDDNPAHFGNDKDRVLNYYAWLQIKSVIKSYLGDGFRSTLRCKCFGVRH